MNKVLAAFLLLIVFPVFAEDPLKAVIDEHIIGNTLTFITHLEEEINDIPGKGLVLAQQKAKDYERNKGNIIAELSLGPNAVVRFLDGQEYRARFSIITAAESNLILLEITFQDRPPTDLYLRFHSDPLFYFSYTHPAMGWIDRYISYHGGVVKK